MNWKNYLVTALIVLCVVVPILLVISYLRNDTRVAPRDSSESSETTGNNALAGVISQQQAEISRLNQDMAWYLQENSRLMSELNACQASVRTTATAPRTVSRATAPAPRTVAPPPPPPTTSTAPAPTPSTTTVRSTATGGQVDLSRFEQNGIIPFCVKINNNSSFHFPQLGVEKKMEFTTPLVDNPTKDGKNLAIRKVEWIQFDYAVTVDGIFYISDAVLSTAIGGQQVTSVTMVAPITREMTKQGEYWIYQHQ